MAVTQWHLHQQVQASEREAHAPAASFADLEVLVRQASLAVDLARAAWNAAEPVQGDAAWAWLQACLSYRDMLLRLAREGEAVLLAPAPRPGQPPFLASGI